MVAANLSAEDLDTLLDANAEWLVVSENGRTFPVTRNEIETTSTERGLLFGTIGENGFSSRRVVNVERDDGELGVTVTAHFGGPAERLRLVPRISAAVLAANVELSRLARANEIASLVEQFEPGAKIVRVALNAGSGRFAEIMLERGVQGRVAVFADVAGTATAENILASAILWFDRLRTRAKKPANELWIIAEKRLAANLQRIHALLRSAARSSISIIELKNSGGIESLRLRAGLSLSRLWCERSRKLNLPSEIVSSETARRIIALWPASIDVMNSRQGETLRFNGMAFARVRKIAGNESAWFGTDRLKRPLNDETWPELLSLVDDLKIYRTADAASKRHDFYRHSPESWLESILRRNIKLLDANLILAPIYNQFRTASADKIDLLALRRDGRLVVIEIKASPDRETPFQAADYWRKIEHLRRRGELKRARVFGDLEILDKPPLVYAVAPALSFHRDFEHFARMLTPEIDLWRFELHENWREEVRVIARRNYFE